MIDCKTVAENANMIINGYAFTEDGELIRILNLNNPEMAAVFNRKCEMMETTMSDIEVQIVKEYLQNNMEFMED